MLSSVPPPPPGTAVELSPAPADMGLIRAENRVQRWFLYYVLAFFGVVAALTGAASVALFVIAVGELVTSLWRPMPKLAAPRYAAPGAASWETPIRILRLYLLIREFGSLVWGFVLLTVFLGVFVALLHPTSLGASSLVVVGMFVVYFGTRPLWYAPARRLLGRLFKGVKTDLSKGGPQVRIAGDGIDVFQPVVVLNGPRGNWLWHVAFSEIDELRMLGAMDAQAYWRSIAAYDPSLVFRAAYELNQYLLGKTPRPAIYQYLAAGAHLLVRGPSVLYLLAYADDTGPPAISAWAQWRAAQPPAQASSAGNLHG
jgi:hypothetical protein